MIPDREVGDLWFSDIKKSLPAGSGSGVCCLPGYEW